MVNSKNQTGSRKTSKKAAASAAKVLNDPNSTKDEKAAAASALAQRGGDGNATQPIPETPQKKLVRFRATEKSPSIEIAAGEYRRTFLKEDEPFEVADDNELEMLRGTGHFVEDKEAEREADES
jgi:hypothetical protein